MPKRTDLRVEICDLGAMTASMTTRSQISCAQAADPQTMELIASA